MSERHDPERFYHCDCIEGGYTPPCEDCATVQERVAVWVESIIGSQAGVARGIREGLYK